MDNFSDLTCFDAEQKQVLLKMQKNMQALVDKQVKEKLESAGLSEDALSLGPTDRKLLEDQKKLQSAEAIWRNNGYVKGASGRVSLSDLMNKDIALTKVMRDNFSSDHPLLIPRVISNIAREAIEPNLVLTPLMQRVNYSAGAQVVFPAWGAIHAADIAEGSEYPERSMELAGHVTATIGKSGVAIKISEEMVRYSQFDVMSMHFRAAGRALARWKEKKVANLILDNGLSIIDNTGAGTKSSTGRAADGSYNGTLCLDDIFYAYGTMVNNGFTPNCLIMHPFAWKIFAQEGIARAFGFINNNSSMMWQLPQGAPGNAPSFGPGGQNGLLNSTYASAPSQLATTFTNVPSIFPANFRIIVTPYMTFDLATNRTTIALCDVNELGVLIVDEELRTEEWNDPSKDIMKVKFRERYALAVLNDGRGIGLMKDISLNRSFDFSDKISLNLTGLVHSLTGDELVNSNV